MGFRGSSPPAFMEKSNMAKMTIKIAVESDSGNYSSDREFPVDEELARPYAMYYDAINAIGGIDLSKRIYELLQEHGPDDRKVEAAVGAIVANAIKG